MASARFDGKVAVITGASSGIGYGTALRLGREGATLSLTGRNEDALNRLVAELTNAGTPEDKILTVIGDIGEDSFREKLISETVEKFGRIDVLVNNAGIEKPSTFEAADLKDFDAQFNINVRAPFHLTKLAIPHLKKTKGNIVNVSSVTGIRTFPAVIVYCMTKAALDQFTKTLAADVAASGVRVNSVNPGVIITEFHRNAGMDEAEYAEFLEASKNAHALGRVGTVKEVAACIAFLASDEASFCTGNVHIVDGGLVVL